MRAPTGILSAALAAMLLAGPALAADPSGLWLTEKRDAKIRIAPCGGALCGAIVWLAEPNDRKTGKPQLDANNADAAKRSRPVMGLHILMDMKQDAADRWTGRIYNVSDDGKIYKGHITLTGPAALKVEGCVAFICQSENWTRTN